MAVLGDTNTKENAAGVVASGSVKMIVVVRQARLVIVVLIVLHLVFVVAVVMVLRLLLPLPLPLVVVVAGIVEEGVTRQV